MNFDKIKTAFERQTRAVTLRPGIGQGTAVTKVSLRDDLTCDIEEGPWKLTADMSPKWGGNGAGPNPGIFGRGALGSCLAMGYAMWAAKLGVPISDVQVEVYADYDTRGMCGFEEVDAGYQQVRYLVKITSPASQADIERVIETADAHSSYLDVFTRAVPLKRELEILEPEE